MMLLFQISGFLLMKFRVFIMKRELGVSIPVNLECWSVQWFSAQICCKGQVCGCVGSWSEFGRKKIYQNVNKLKSSSAVARN